MVDQVQKLNYKQFWTVGSGSSGLLLNGSLDDIHNFQKVDVEAIFSQSEIIQLEIDGMMGFYLNSKGEVFKFGECEYDEKKKVISIYNLTGFKINPIPQQISFHQAKITQISCGWSHAIFVDCNQIFQQKIQCYHKIQNMNKQTENHKLYGFGSNKFGELGFGKDVKLVQQIEEIPFSKIEQGEIERHEIQDIKCGFRQSFIITKLQEQQQSNSQIQQSVYCTGQNKSFELGGFHNSPVVYNFSKNLQLVEEVDSIKKFICGYKFGCILNNHNKLYGWGDNKYGQITGLDLKYEKIVQISDNVQDVSAGWNHLMILKEGNQLFCVGRGDMGQIGDDKLQNVKDLTPIKDIEGEIQIIECGSEANYVKSTAGIYVWGWNEHGNLGNGNLENVNKPTLLQFPNHKDINQIKSGGAVCYLIENSLIPK